MELSNEVYEAALIGLEQQRRAILAKIAEVNAALRGDTPKLPWDEAKPGFKRKRKLSAVGRAAISAAGKRRWEKFHAAKRKAA